mgnify:CR=1 FL=1|tara:strand:- start:138 stop:296 length:159 start_codon:yes stop_codon:yes gene_type:complete
MLSIKERKMILSLKEQVNVKIAGFGLKIRRLENENRSLRMKVKRLEKLLKGE